MLVDRHRFQTGLGPLPCVLYLLSSTRLDVRLVGGVGEVERSSLKACSAQKLHTILKYSSYFWALYTLIGLPRSRSRRRKLGDLQRSLLRRLQCEKQVFDGMWKRLVRRRCTAFLWASATERGDSGENQL